MSEQDKKSPSGVPTQGVFVVIAIIASLLIGTQFPFQSTRPPDPNIPELTPTDIRARLWEDPFAAVQNYIKKEKDEKRGPQMTVYPQEQTALDILDKFAPDNPKDNSTDNLTALMVMVSGGPYNEDAENRLRSRHAVVSGLDVLGYAPEYGRFISYMDLRCWKKESPLLPDIIPFEWFKTRDNETTTKTKRVIVMWLDDTAFLKQDHPLEIINNFIREGQQSLGYVKLAQEVFKKLPSINDDMEKALKDVLKPERIESSISKIEKAYGIEKAGDNKTTAKMGSYVINLLQTNGQDLSRLQGLIDKKGSMIQYGILNDTNFVREVTQTINRIKSNEFKVWPEIYLNRDFLISAFDLKQIKNSVCNLLGSDNSSKSDKFSTVLALGLCDALTEKGNISENDKMFFGQGLFKGLFKTALGKSLKGSSEGNDASKAEILSCYFIGDMIYGKIEQQRHYKKKDQFSPELIKQYSAVQDLIGELVLDSLKVPRIKAKIIGPTSSGMLKGMVEEKLKPDNETRLFTFCDMQMFSPRATASDNSTLSLDKKYKEKVDEIIRTNKKKGKQTYLQDIFESKFYFLRTVATDNCTTGKLVEELARRGVDAGKDTIYLVSEWDTLYGRELPDAFIKAAHKNEQNNNNNIVKFSYLRGIDGNLPNKPKKNESGTEDTKAGTSNKKDTEFEKATGENQYDYLRRLAQYMKSLQSDNCSGNVKAIGVLGSDAYDKLLVLQALRFLFPEVIFFTTDLDAVLLQRDHYKWTHNLVVASSFGLRLNENLQKDIPPFRDNYQTATFFATLLSVGMCDNATVPLTQETIKTLLVPRIYEIGRTGAFDLSGKDNETLGIKLVDGKQEGKDSKVNSNYDNAPCNPKRLVFCTNNAGDNEFDFYLHPQRKNILGQLNLRKYISEGWIKNWLTIIFTIVFFLVLFYLLYKLNEYYFDSDQEELSNKQTLQRITFKKRAKDELKEVIKYYGRLVKKYKKELLVLIGLFGALCIAIILQGYEGEPWALFEGVSIWPTEIIRLLCGVIALCLLYKCRKAMKKQDAKIQNKYCLNPTDASDHAPPPGYIDPIKVWKVYKTASDPNSRIKRVYILTALYYLLALSLMAICGGYPATPFRGISARSVDMVILFLFAVPSLLFLIYWLLDTTIGSIKLFRGLSQGKTDWPDDVIKYYQGKLMKNTEESTSKKAGNAFKDYLIEWIDMKVVMKHSAVVGKFIYCPFVVISLMILARSSYFDYWPMTTGLIIAIGFALFVSALSVILLRREAEKARKFSLIRLSEYLINAKGQKDNPQLAEQIKLLIDSIKAIRTGAFAPFLEQPLVQSVMLLLGSGGGLWLLEILLKR